MKWPGWMSCPASYRTYPKFRSRILECAAAHSKCGFYNLAPERLIGHLARTTNLSTPPKRYLYSSSPRMKSNSRAFVFVGPLQKMPQQHPAGRKIHEAPVNSGVIDPDAVQVIKIKIPGSFLSIGFQEGQLQPAAFKSSPAGKMHLLAHRRSEEGRLFRVFCHQSQESLHFRIQR